MSGAAGWPSDDLLRPEAFAAVAPTRGVSRIETHVSWVFLLDRDVFKVKKPVDLGFLDFRSLDRRRRACDDEVRLNARLAAEVYRGVVPITRGADGRCAVGGAGPAIDWAVHMTRLPDEWRADRLLAAGALGAARVDAVAAFVAEFHRAARSGADVSRYGLPAVVERNVRENFEQTRATLPSYVSPAEAEAIVGWQARFVRDERARFERRASSGRIREGHGDLRLEHVYFSPRRGIRVLDCVEFDERFRCADVCADVAFLSMDLTAHGRADLAERLLASYAREADDFDLYSVVDFYEAYRAFIRGKVTAMLAGDDAAEPAARRRAASEARRYFVLALSAGRAPLLRPAVIAVGGVIASGKSAIAGRVSAAASAPIVDADRTRKSMLGVGALEPLHDPSWSGAYDPAVGDRVYDEVLRRADVVLASGRPVVLDASFRAAAYRRAARDLARAHGVPFHFVECRAPAEVCRARLASRERRRTVSDGRLAVFDDFCARYEPVVELAPGERVVLDTTGPVEDSAATLRRAIGVWPEGLAG